MGLPKLWGNAPDGSGHGFVYSHVKSIYYNWAQKKLLSTKLDEIDTSILDLDTEKFDISKIIASTNITQTGYVMDGKTCADAIAQLNSNMQMHYLSGTGCSAWYNSSIVILQLNITNATINAGSNRFNMLALPAELKLKSANFARCVLNTLSSGWAPDGNQIYLSFDSEALNVSPSYFFEKLPMLGEIACGEPKFTNEDRESYVNAGTDIKADFCLKARGDSMINARIHDGDIVFIQRQDIVENGEIAAVIVNGNSEATLKRFYYYKDKALLILKPENPIYEDWIYQNEELNEVRVLGKAIAFQSDVK